MILLTSPPRISLQCHPCPDCQASTSVEVITKIESAEDLTDFITRNLNRAQCFSCGARVEAPVRVTVNLDDFPLIHHECVPIALLNRPEILEDLLQEHAGSPKRVYSHDELERSIEASLLIEMHRRGQQREEGEVVFSR